MISFCWKVSKRLSNPHIIVHLCYSLAKKGLIYCNFTFFVSSNGAHFFIFCLIDVQFSCFITKTNIFVSPNGAPQFLSKFFVNTVNRDGENN